MALYDYEFKLALIGDKGVGKSSFLIRFSEDTFSGASYSSLGVDYKIRTVDQDGETFKLQIWDGPPQTVTFFYKDTHGVFICYSIDNRNSFENASKWINDVDRNAPIQVEKFLLGCKSDLSNRSVDSSEGESLAIKYGIPFMEISSKNATNIHQAVMKMVTNVKKVVDSKPVSSSKDSSGKEKSSKKCIIC